MEYNFIPDIKEILNGDEKDFVKLFYIVDENKTIIDVTPLGKILTACQNIEMDFGVTVYDIISGKVDSDFALMIDLKLWIDSEIETLPITKNKKTKSKNENKILKFKRDE
jgi:hypothetical protein